MIVKNRAKRTPTGIAQAHSKRPTPHPATTFSAPLPLQNQKGPLRVYVLSFTALLPSKLLAGFRAGGIEMVLPHDIGSFAVEFVVVGKQRVDRAASEQDLSVAPQIYPRREENTMCGIRSSRQFSVRHCY
jgi:hypothetical protein